MNKIRIKLLVIISILSLPVYEEQASSSATLNKYATGFAMIPGVPKDCKAI